MIDLHRSSFSFAGQGRFAWGKSIPGLSGMIRLRTNHREIALDDALCFEIACSNHLMVSPPLRGSNPYPCGSLTYRISVIIVGPSAGFVNCFPGKNSGGWNAFFGSENGFEMGICAGFLNVKNGLMSRRTMPGRRCGTVGKNRMYKRRKVRNIRLFWGLMT